MAASGLATSSFYRTRARAQHERYHFTLIQPNLDKNDGESDSNDDELASIDESIFFLQSSSVKSNDESDAEVGDGNESEIAVEENNAVGSSGKSRNTQIMRWKKQQPLLYDVKCKGEPFLQLQ